VPLFQEAHLNKTGGSMSNNTNNNYGIGFSGLLTVLFIGLKLTGYITWSWLWVLSPLWISFLIALLIVGMVVGVAIIADK